MSVVARRLPGALKERLEELADEYAESNLLGVGQFCTNPGIVVVQVTLLQQMHSKPATRTRCHTVRYPCAAITESKCDLGLLGE